MDFPRPPPSTAPSIWYEAVAAPHRKLFGKLMSSPLSWAIPRSSSHLRGNHAIGHGVAVGFNAFVHHRPYFRHRRHARRARSCQAQHLLISTDHDTARIAFEVGFGSTSRFYEAFKKTSGRTPRKYRMGTRPRAEK
ncbi:MAG: helix-turn-helix domain-containing protein [Rubrobacter sp.]|nr:helix-turn-helix domain-containing protein [Rubrobacter sp.]